MHYLKLFLPTMVFCFILDAIWIGVIAKNLYENSIGHLLRKANGALSPNWPAAIVVYIVIVLGVIVFALPRAENNYLHGLFYGALLGMVLYGLYDFTNFSILANWPLKITLIDFVWGMVLCSLTTCFAVFMQNKM